MGVNPISWFAKTKTGTKLYKWAASPKGQEFLYNTMPTLETILSTTIYVAATEKQRKLNRREKNVLQWQNVLSGVLGATLGTILNRKVFAFGDKIIENLDSKKITDPHKIKGAIRVLTPIFMTALLMRFALPTATAYVSGVIEENRAQKKKLDYKA